MVEVVKMVGATRFELATSPTPKECATRLRYAPTEKGRRVKPQVAPQVKGETLAPAEYFLTHCRTGAPRGLANPSKVNCTKFKDLGWKAEMLA